jgi:pyruvate/2-oxoglutarate dehydrogenase complex dihydrolipoamide acyltransferase (E2) component
MERIKYKNSQKLKGMVDEVFVADGDSVTEGQTLAIISTQGDKYEILSHIDGIIKNVYIIKSLLVSHGDIIFDIYTKKDIKKMVSKDETLGETLRFSLNKAGYLEEIAEDIESGNAVDDFEVYEEKEKTARFKSIGDNNENNFHSDIPTDEHFAATDTFDFDKTAEVAKPVENDETLGINIPSSLETLDNFSFTAKEKPAAAPVEEDVFSFSTKEKPAAPVADNNDEAMVFLRPSTAIDAEKRLDEEKAFMEKALANAINQDSVTEIIGEDAIVSGDVELDTISEIEKDFNKVDTLVVDLEFKIKDQAQMQRENVFKTDELVPPTAHDLTSTNHASTSTVEVNKYVENQIREEKQGSQVDISDEAMTKSLERKLVNSQFLNVFSNSDASRPMAENDHEAIYNNLSSEIQKISNAPEREEPIVEENVDYEEELDRIESLLDINNSDIDLSAIAKPIVPNEPTEVAAPVVPEEKVVELVETKTQSLAQTVKALQKEVKSLANAQPVQPVQPSQPAKAAKTVATNKVTTVTTTNTALSFVTNATALINLHSLLHDAYQNRGLDLEFNTFITLAVMKAVAGESFDDNQLTLHTVVNQQLKATNVKIDSNKTLTDILNEMQKGTKTVKKTDVTIYDFTNTSIKNATIPTSGILNVIIGKVDEHENLTGSMETKIIFDSEKMTMDSAIKIMNTFNGLIENPGFLI